MNKKIIWCLLLVIFIIVLVVGGIWLAGKGKNDGMQSAVVNAPKQYNVQNRNSDEENTSSSNIDENKTKTFEDIYGIKPDWNKYVKIQKDDGILYAIGGTEIQPDMIVGDNYFDTTLRDVFLNPNSYYGKNIQVEGMFLRNHDSKNNQDYTFVARYSTSNLCPYCPAGYSYIEYQLKDEIDAKLTDTETWLRIIGKLEKGNDETSNYTDYFYLKVDNIEIMNERGNDTVNN